MATLRRRILWSLLGAFALAVAVFALALSHESACGPGPALAAGTPAMKALVRRCYGGPDVLRIEDVEKPAARDGRVLVRVHAASVNPADWHFVRGVPYIIRIEFGFGAPKNPRVGIDFAGTVESVGKGVTKFRPGDRVFGGGNGALAEYVTMAEDGNLALIPPGIGFEQAAAVNVAGLTALQTLRDRAGVKLLEPIMDVEVVTPGDFVGSVIGDINSRRGQIRSQEMRGNATVVRANVPLANMFGYVSQLRSMSQGRAMYTMQFAHYAEVPRNVADEVKAKYA